MAGLLSGLEQLGLGDLEDLSVYEEAKAEEAKPEEEKNVKPTIREEEFLFDKTQVCPVCGISFPEKTVRAGKARMIGSDIDLRPKYEHIDMLKYDIISCPKCGYTALGRYFKNMSPAQADMIKRRISASYKPRKEKKAGSYTYEEALGRYKLALANAIVKQSKNSERAYICLRAGWLVRGMLENLDPSVPEYDKIKKDLTLQEDDFLKHSLEGFINARKSESFPICGMDEATLDYVVAATAMRFEQWEIGSKLCQAILISGSANPRIKDRTRDLQAEIRKRRHESMAGGKEA